MKVAEYLNNYCFEELRPELEKLYIANDVCFYKLSNDEWGAVYSEFCKQEKIQTTKTIYLHDRWEGCSPFIDMNCVVFDENDNMMGPLAMYPNLKEIMDMDVVVDTSISITDVELTVGLFWEITYTRTEEKERLVEEALQAKKDN